MTDMRRREFITLVAGGLAVWPLAARAQQSGKVSRIGFLGAASASGYARQVEGFRSGLHELGYIEGINIVIAYRWAEGNYARLPELAAELIRSNVDVIVTHGSPPSETPRDLADFQTRHGEAPRFAGKGREIALGRCRVGRCEGRSAGRLRASAHGGGRVDPTPGRGNDDPPFKN
jgi:hypothetical protein